MPWKNSTTMDQKIAFIREWQSGKYYFNSLCNAYSISRQAGYDLIKKFKEHGLEDALKPLSKRPKNSPNVSSENIVELVKKWRKKQWGAKKIKVKIAEEIGEELTPSVTTIHNILIREQLVIHKTKRRIVKPSNPVFDPKEPNEIWSADYKGNFLLGNRKRCYPLTICDSKSRFILDITGQYKETTKNVIKVFKKVFREYGMPQQLHTDNGSAFASRQSPCGYGALSYWLLDHGIEPVFSDPGRPDQNGRHERMHRDLKAKTCKPPAKCLSAQNRRMNAFVKEYNQERPHEHLDMMTPAKIHLRSNREWSSKILPVEYDTDLIVKKVTKNGAIRWGAYEWVCISRCLYGKYVALEKLGNRVWKVYYREYCLGYFIEGENIVKERYFLLNHDKDLIGRIKPKKK